MQPSITRMKQRLKYFQALVTTAIAPVCKFVLNDCYAIVGTQPYEMFEKALKRLIERKLKVGDKNEF
jgi:predicted DsbA family dithiol-disulfide isomerase